ncbi:NAD(P)-dependent oxidoreductase [Vibrio salinus]|uniref:NAD(P)-dependent oxidoreductase n=1 Tax=Vibrio salinus TaxID=2899784 RepID=UPI001E627BF8|nr:NAD(P)-dependent oxidoreductase [Vibrio salinus]MCE0494840.1 NAD(P)-dependent oxidoreductase [Vibrio salinus]
MDINNVSFIGLGVMGYPMAGHLQNSGLKTTVFNRTEEKAKQWTRQYGGDFKLTPKDASQGSQVVFMCVGNDDDVRSVVYGADGILAGLNAGAILVDHTTTSATLSVELARACAEKNIHFIDAPVSGGQAGAENGCLTIMCGGDKAIYNQILPVMKNYGKQATLMGENGQGQRCKMVNQICIAGILQGLSEAILLAKEASLDISQVVDVLKHGAAGSWQMENRAETMAQEKFDFGFAIDWMRKDLGICLNEAKLHSLALPLTESVDTRYQSLQEKGLGRMDTSVLIESYKCEK